MEERQCEAPSWTRSSQVMKGIEAYKSPGHGGISPCLLREMNDTFVSPLELLFGISMEEGSVPVVKDQMCLFFMKGVRENVLIYRSVSLSSTACLLLKEILRKPVDEFLLTTEVRGSMGSEGTSHALHIFCTPSMSEYLPGN